MSDSDPELSRLVSVVKKKLNTNDYEHSRLWTFYKSCIVSGFLGLLLGSFIEGTMKTIEEHSPIKPESRLGCASLLGIQLSLIALSLYIGNVAPFIRRVLYFDDWLMGTFAGFLFALCFINIQGRLNMNMTCVVFGVEERR